MVQLIFLGMTTKEKYTEIIKEVVRNEAVSKDKLVALAKKHKANKLKIELFLRQAGVIENMGKGVNRVLIRGQEIDPYVDAVVEKSNTSKKRPPKKKVIKENEYMRPSHPNLQIIAEEGIDLYAKMLEDINTFMDKVQTNTNKQNEYISELAAKIDEMQREALSQRIERFEKLFKEHVDRNSGFMSEHTCDIKELKKRIKELEEKLNNIPSVLDEVEFFNEHLDFHKRIDKRIAAIEDKLKEQNGHPAKNNNLALIKAARGLLADIE